MLKKLRKRIRQRNVKYARLAVALGAALTLAGETTSAWAATEIGAQEASAILPPAYQNITWTGTESNHYTITPTHVGENGAYAHEGGTITLTYVDISTNGPGSHGLYANDWFNGTGGAISLTQASIKNEDGDGAAAEGNSNITLQDVTITSKGNNFGYSLSAERGGSIRMTGGSIQRQGYGGIAASIFGPSNIVLQDVNINSSTTWHNNGLYAMGGSITMTGGSIFGVASDPQAETNGAIANQRGTVTLQNVAITTYGLGGGVEATERGILEMTGGSIATHNANAYGAWAGPGYWGEGGSITLTDTTVQSVGTVLYAKGDSSGTGSITATVHGQNIASGTKLMEAGDYGIINLTAYNGSTLSGLATVSGSGVANMSLNGGSTWINPGDSTLTKLELSSGNVRFGAPAANTYHGLTVKDLAGSGTFYLNANLSDGTADRVNVTGSVSGSYQLVVNNQGGAYGIAKVVDIASGATNTATFSGGSDVGAYRYGVTKGSVLASAYSGLDGEDYYFYNTLTASTPVRAAIGNNAGSVVAWYGEKNEIKKRMGELRMGTQSSDDFWVRTYADKFNVRPAGVDGFSQVMRGVEVGKDTPQAFDGGKKYTGFLLGTGRATNTFNSGGEGTTNSTYLGAYASWLRNDGSYLDLIGKYNWFRHSFDTPLLGGGSDSGSYRSNGLGLSAEIGKRFERGNGVFIQPEVELSALWSNGASYATANGLAVETPSARSLELRLGCTAGKKWQGADGATRQVYGKAGWVNEYAGDSHTVVDSAAFDSSLKGHQWVTGIGFIEDTKRYQLYLDVEKSWGDTTSKQWGANLGYRWKF